MLLMHPDAWKGKKWLEEELFRRHYKQREVKTTLDSLV